MAEYTNCNNTQKYSFIAHHTTSQLTCTVRIIWPFKRSSAVIINSS